MRVCFRCRQQRHCGRQHPDAAIGGKLPRSNNDNGTSNGIGIVVNQNYLYAGYTLSNTIATFSVGAGCQLSFLGDITVTPLNGGWIAGMALNGNMLVVTYIDGSIQSFNTANGIPISNNDEQNATGFASASFPTAWISRRTATSPSLATPP